MGRRMRECERMIGVRSRGLSQSEGTTTMGGHPFRLRRAVTYQRPAPDSVDDAIASPEREQPFEALGLKPDEYDADSRDPRPPPHQR